MASAVENDKLKKRTPRIEQCENSNRQIWELVFFLAGFEHSASTGLSLLFRLLIFDGEKQKAGSSYETHYFAIPLLGQEAFIIQCRGDLGPF